ncbi:hypothetical protein APX70_05538 [Pseudomonas syringae pv. maculicola]|uniref:Uncharacterized protein n=1 Tax=Pseudomonas syringae pv. maculicola TaxID=59511 RepID=A0A3M2V3J8_PSEYM|nr:hypothetical protein APX70_05538 [Pseudomonas syringae pv. maculicola]
MPLIGIKFGKISWVIPSDGLKTGGEMTIQTAARSTLKRLNQGIQA